MNICFRNPRSDEIEVRVKSVSAYGVILVPYITATACQNILDETFGWENWQKRYSRDNANCTLSVWSDVRGQWIEKEDVGSPSNTDAEKGLASDAFKRAAVCFGVGRCLRTAPKIFVPAGKLTAGFSSTGNATKCDCKFDVTSINYTDNKIADIKISAYYSGSLVGEFTFVSQNTKLASINENHVKNTPAKVDAAKKKTKVTTASSNFDEITLLDLTGTDKQAKIEALAAEAEASLEYALNWASTVFGRNINNVNDLSDAEYEKLVNAMSKRAAK